MGRVRSLARGALEVTRAARGAGKEESCARGGWGNTVREGVFQSGVGNGIGAGAGISPLGARESEGSGSGGALNRGAGAGAGGSASLLGEGIGTVGGVARAVRCDSWRRKALERLATNPSASRIATRASQWVWCGWGGALLGRPRMRGRFGGALSSARA